MGESVTLGGPSLDGGEARARRWAVPVERLRWPCDPDLFDFECTDDIAPLEGFIGQDRALRSIEFGLAVDRPGYNIFVTGLTGTGRTSVIKTYLQDVVARKGAAALGLPQLADWCYVYNVADPDRPRILTVPAGGGRRLQAQMTELVANLRTELTRAFGSEEYQARRKELVEAGQAQQRELFARLQREAEGAGFYFQVSNEGVALIPLRQGRPMTEETYAHLDPAEQAEIESRRAPLWEKVQATFEQARLLDRQIAEQVRGLEQRTAEFAIAKPFNNLLAENRVPDVLHYIEEIRAYTLAHLDLFARADAKPEPGPDAPAGMPSRDPFLAYRVNVFVDNSRSSGPPVIIETNPTWSNLFGRIERRAFMGAYFSDHTMVKPGSLCLANGGYLVVNARDLLANPGVWENLKRAIRNKESRTEDPAEAFGLLAPQGLRPQPFPLDVKVIVTGDNNIYHALSRYDEDFWEIFKVKADFDYQIERSREYAGAYAGFVCATCKQERLRPFSRAAVARVVEHGARLVADQHKLSTRFGVLKDVLIEADYWAGRDGAKRVGPEHVRRAIDERVYRSDLVAQRIRELIAEGTFMVDVSGAVTGQVNGLAVYDLGDIAFGRPSRITARTFMGRAGIVNIEREAHLSGNTHDKGVLILSGYLGWKYAQDKPLTLAASICFEQSYEGVDGDSASSTELYAILSSLADLPIKQGIAVTGSVNQKGEVQPIGGVNEKIEGYFDVCKASGLTGEQGVLIPRQNVRNLMLREDVVEAVAKGQFHVWAVGTVDEGLEVLTGVPAGERQADGTYPAGTVHCLVDQRLRALAEGLQSFGADRKGAGREGAETSPAARPADQGQAPEASAETGD